MVLAPLVSLGSAELLIYKFLPMCSDPDKSMAVYNPSIYSNTTKAIPLDF